MSSPVSAVVSAAIAASGVGYQLHHDKDDYHRDDADDYILEHALGELYALARILDLAAAGIAADAGMFPRSSPG